MANWTFIGAATAGGGDDDPLTLTSHANTQVGDLLVVLIEQEEDGQAAPTPPTGDWEALLGGNGPDRITINEFWRIAASAGAVGYSFDMAASVVYTTGIIATFRPPAGVTVSVDADNAVNNGTADANGDFDASAITVSAEAAADGALLVGFGGIYGAAANWTPQDGTSEAAENVESCMVYKTGLPAGSTGAITFDSGAGNTGDLFVTKLTVFRAETAAAAALPQRAPVILQAVNRAATY